MDSVKEALSLMKMEKYEKAASLLSNVLGASKSEHKLVQRALEARAVCFERVGNLKGAISDCNTLVKNYPLFVGGYLRLGKLFRLQGKPQDAINIYRKALQYVAAKDHHLVEAQLNILANKGQIKNNIFQELPMELLEKMLRLVSFQSRLELQATCLLAQRIIRTIFPREMLNPKKLKESYRSVYCIRKVPRDLHLVNSKRLKLVEVYIDKSFLPLNMMLFIQKLYLVRCRVSFDAIEGLLRLRPSITSLILRDCEFEGVSGAILKQFSLKTIDIDVNLDLISIDNMEIYAKRFDNVWVYPRKMECFYGYRNRSIVILLRSMNPTEIMQRIKTLGPIKELAIFKISGGILPTSFTADIFGLLPNLHALYIPLPDGLCEEWKQRQKSFYRVIFDPKLADDLLRKGVHYGKVKPF